MLERIYNKHKIELMMNSFYSIFDNTNPFKPIINRNYKMIVFYPTKGYFISEKQFKSLINTLQLIGEKTFYISEIENGKESFNLNNDVEKYSFKHFIVDVELDINEYFNSQIILENAIYSTKGTWGIIISHEEHAILAADKNFMSIFKNEYTCYKNDIENFKETWINNNKEYGSDISWIKNILSYKE